MMPRSMEIDICPRWLLYRFGIEERVQNDVAILVSTLLAIAALPLLERCPHFCLMQRMLGVPCPGCGVLHSLQALRQGSAGLALRYNPGGILIAASLLWQLISRPFAIARHALSARVARISSILNNLTVSLLFAAWILRV